MTSLNLEALPVAAQRAVVERQLGGPALRIVMSADEWRTIQPLNDWCACRLSDGRVAIWRAQADLDRMVAAGRHDLAGEFSSRVIEDDIK